jgi:subtilase family serine protease
MKEVWASDCTDERAWRNVQNFPDTTSLNGGLKAVYEQIAADNRATVVSTSIAACEPDITGEEMGAEHAAFEEMAAQGQSILAGSADWGSDCNAALITSTHKHDVAVWYPASDPFVTGVGGTHLNLDPNTNAWISEAAWRTPEWNPPLASGGGVSRVLC